MRLGPLRSTAALIAGCLLASGLARAQQRDAAAAEVLFEEAKRLFEQGDHAAACPKFSESYRLDPATGALFALALCHERAGKIASAWVEFMEAAGRANSERNAEREQAARERATALEPRLSFLEIRVDQATASIPGVTVLHDGVALRPAAFGAAIPVDPGRHVVRAEAPGHHAWEGTVSIGETPERETFEVPALEANAAPPPPPPAPPVGATVAPRSDGFVFTPLRVGGIAMGAAGVASLGFAAAASWRALDKKASSNEHCGPTTCEPEGQNDRMIAREAATWATVGVISGAALLGAGAILFVLGSPPASPEQTSRTLVLVGSGHAALRHEF